MNRYQFTFLVYTNSLYSMEWALASNNSQISGPSDLFGLVSVMWHLEYSNSTANELEVF